MHYTLHNWLVPLNIRCCIGRRPNALFLSAKGLLAIFDRSIGQLRSRINQAHAHTKSPYKLVYYLILSISSFSAMHGCVLVPNRFGKILRRSH